MKNKEVCCENGNVETRLQEKMPVKKSWYYLKGGKLQTEKEKSIGMYRIRKK